jgi:hypothetical protein
LDQEILKGIMKGCPRRRAVDKLLAEQGGQVITTHIQAMRLLSANNRQKDEQFRASLLQNTLSYVRSLVAVCEAGCCDDEGFHGQLINWIQISLIPPLRHAVPSDYLMTLEAAVMMPWQLQKQDTHDTPAASTGTAAVAVASALKFTMYQHQSERCERCANPCEASKMQGLKCKCGAVTCAECYELTRTDISQLLRSRAFTFKCDACREQQEGGEALVVRKNRACSTCRVVFPRPDDKKTLKAQCDR